MKYVPEEFKTQELCRLAIKNEGRALEYVPEEFKTYELCKIAVTKWGSALEFVPEELKTKELCELAVKHYGGALEFVPKKILNLDMCMAAIKINYPSALEYISKWVPEEYQEKLMNIYHNNLQARNNKKEEIKRIEDVLVCPQCKGELEITSKRAVCRHCKNEYLKKDNIWDFRV